MPTLGYCDAWMCVSAGTYHQPRSWCDAHRRDLTYKPRKEIPILQPRHNLGLAPKFGRCLLGALHLPIDLVNNTHAVLTRNQHRPGPYQQLRRRRRRDEAPEIDGPFTHCVTTKLFAKFSITKVRVVSSSPFAQVGPQKRPYKTQAHTAASAMSRTKKAQRARCSYLLSTRKTLSRAKGRYMRTTNRRLGVCGEAFFFCPEVAENP
jgi:hypothetical protein